MKVRKQNVFLILFIISYVAVAPFVFVEMYKNSGLGELFAAHDEGTETTDAVETTTEWRGEIETPPDSGTEETTTADEKQGGWTETSSEAETETETSPCETTTEEQTPGSSSESPDETTTNLEPETTTKEEESTELETTTEGMKKPQFMTVEPSYFDDALFIGDSRTVGLYEYGVLDSADFFCNVGMSVYNVHKTEVSIPTVGKTSLTGLLETGKYGKIYVMLGMNELGYGFDKTVRKYGELLKEIQSLQPDAVIYIQANLHVTKKRSDSDAIYNNKAINRFNKAVSEYADNEKIYYIDVNTLFDDKDGNFDKKYTGDNTHPFARYYTEWSKWLCEMVVIR